MNDWLKELKVGDYVCLYGGIHSRIVKIDGETKMFWKSGDIMFRKDNGRIRGDRYRIAIESKPEDIADSLMRRKLAKMQQLARSANKLTESDLDAIIAIFERAGK